VTIQGHDVVEDSVRARKCIGYMPEAAPLYPEMRTREYLTFRAELKGVARKKRASAVGYAMEAARVADMAHTLIGHLSKGYRQRVALADALVASPPLLILDEPTAGLDPNQIRQVRELIRAIGKDHTILLSTHILPEVESTCDRALVIARGRLVAEGTLDELRAHRRAVGATLLVTDPENKAESVLGDIDGVARVTARSEEATAPLRRVSLEFAKGSEGGGAALEEAVVRLAAAGVRVREATPTRATLEDVFAELTQNDARAVEER
jgi:ABC-2 type transport system ATP-binding protein